MIRLDYYVRRRAELEQEEFQAKWLQEHGKLWVKHADTLGVRRYTQVHDWPEHPLCEAWRAGYGVEGQPYDGVSTAYWPSYRAAQDALSWSQRPHNLSPTPETRVPSFRWLSSPRGHAATSARPRSPL